MSTSEPSIFYWRDLAEMYRRGIDSYSRRVSEPDFTLPARVGLWTDLCREIEKWVVVQRLWESRRLK